MIKTTVKEKKDYYIEFTDEQMKELGFEKNQKFTVKLLEDNSGLQLTPFAKIQLDLGDFDRDVLEYLISQSIEQDLPINDIISNCLESFLTKEETY